MDSDTGGGVGGGGGGGKAKPLTYKIKATSRETTPQKAINILDADLRNYWSTGTNTKEWILLELQEPCLLSQIRIYNKSVLEWELAAGLRYKPETFVKVRQRCEAPRRDIIYPMNYTPCRYVRLSCLRGSPIAIFFIQLIGISVPGLEPEFQPVINYLSPQIVSHEQDSDCLHLQLLQDVTDRLHIFLPQLEAELTKCADEQEASTRFLAMLAGPLFPILQIVSERETARCSPSVIDSEVSRNSLAAPALTVSSNFEPRRLRSMSPFPLPTSRSIVFRPDAIFMLLRKAFGDNDLGAVCKVASRILHYLAETTIEQQESSVSTGGTSSLLDETSGPKLSNHASLSDYSKLFGDNFLIPDVDWNPSYVNVLDIGAIEEGILHVLYACAAHPLHCSKLAGCATDFWLVLPLIQALLPVSLAERSLFRHMLNCDEYQCSSFPVKYPDLSFFFPVASKEFKAFREVILEAVALQLRSLPSSAVPDILCWFSDLCLSPFLEKTDKAYESLPPVKGYYAKNGKAIILYVFGAIISEHMEAVVPELPRLMQVLGSLCRSSYSDVPFLSSILRLLKPIISYSLSKVSNEEKHLNGNSCLNFETLCFSELTTYLAQERKDNEYSSKRVNISLVIFILASVFPYLSFDRKKEAIQLSLLWVDFPTFAPTTTFHDYLCSFQQLLRSCNEFLVRNLKILGLIPMPLDADVSLQALVNNEKESFAWFPDDFCYGRLKKGLENAERDDTSVSNSTLGTGVYNLSSDELGELSVALDDLISKLSLTIELSWNLHPQLSESVAVCSAQCLVYSRCLSSVMHVTPGLAAVENDNKAMCKSSDEVFAHWKIGTEALAKYIMVIQEKRCWEVASTKVDCLLRVPAFCSLDNLVGTLSAVIEKNMFSAPKIAWRLRTDSWLSNLFSRGILMHESGLCLIDLISKMLSHPEPEQRFTALTHLGRLLGLDVNGGWVVPSSPSFYGLASHDGAVSISESVLSHLVSNTWDQVAFVASSDASLHLRTLAKALIVQYIPFAERAKLQSFLETADIFFHDLGNFACPMGDGLFAQLSLALVAGVCLYCPAEDLSLVPQNLWRYIETVGGSTTGRFGEMDKRICEALCKVKQEEDDAKAALKEALSSCPSKEFDPEFGNTRESVLQVLANSTSVQSYFDVFAEKMDQEVRELEEAELEMDIVQNEIPGQGFDRDENELPYPSSTMNNGHRLQQIKEAIKSLEKSRLKQEIIARRQKKLSLKCNRQKYLEEAVVREAELLLDLDRQRTSEVEMEIERQRLLELERAKTNELRFNLDLEKERQTQREIQRELEQVESGSRPPRREFSSSTHSSNRPRDRYRDRDNGRASGDGSLRASTISVSPDMPVNGPSLAAAPNVLSGSRAFSGQLPTILQARDRADECSSSYEENFDGSKDSGDAGSTGDPELASGFDGLSGTFVGSQRHVSRGSKSRQILERRERDGRREGKWERKH